jgi:hypothetical protein
VVNWILAELDCRLVIDSQLDLLSFTSDHL